MGGVKKLLGQGVDVNGRDGEGCSALHWAADRGNIEVGPTDRKFMTFKKYWTSRKYRGNLEGVEQCNLSCNLLFAHAALNTVAFFPNFWPSV